MKKIFQIITRTNPSDKAQHWVLLVYRVLLSAELIYAHGLKKMGVGVAEAEVIPNPLHLPEAFNSLFADAANLVFPLFVIVGLFTRIAILPILAVTLTGYFVLHFHDAPLIKDTPYIYSLNYLLLLVMGPGRYSLDAYIFKRSGHL
ncbi:DoxX family protein [Chitinophaga ginsengisoli]|uniref:Putative oxidoreductase n=1 Tax=Chitinophaga ginsengisoli TaxID=363837 RepID=A0A2P8GAK9_9BACT|nr:DoxX family protein [Chitinophaga ginsengisoli]PSL31027.1 putative oxidoreductase [Chitinophaga ginsengisoli]